MKTATLIWNLVVAIIMIVLILDALWCDRYDKATAYLLMVIGMKLEEIKSKL